MWSFGPVLGWLTNPAKIAKAAFVLGYFFWRVSRGTRSSHATEPNKRPVRNTQQKHRCPYLSFRLKIASTLGRSPVVSIKALARQAPLKIAETSKAPEVPCLQDNRGISNTRPRCTLASFRPVLFFFFLKNQSKHVPKGSNS